MTKRITALRGAVLVLGLGLAGCGGGSGSVSSTPPPPTPGGSYPRMADVVNGSYTFNTVGVSYSALPSGFAGGGSFALGSGATIAYNAASDTFTVTAPGGLGTTFTAANLVASPPGTVRFFKNTGAVQDDVTLTVPLTYAMLTVWNRTDASGITDPGLIGGGTTGRISFGGSQTTPSDVPRAGSATYSAQLTGAAQSGGVTYNLTASTATFSANFAANTVQTSITLGGVPLAGGSAVSNFGTFSGAGTISTTGPGFAGSLGGPGGMGIYQGAFFGPQAAEMGYGYVLQGLSFSSAGAVVGTKQ